MCYLDMKWEKKNISTRGKKKKKLQNDYFYLVNKIFEVVSDLFVKLISERMGLLLVALFLCVFLPVASTDKKIAHCCFHIDAMKLKKQKKTALIIAVFGLATRNILALFFGFIL